MATKEQGRNMLAFFMFGILLQLPSEITVTATADILAARWKFHCDGGSDRNNKAGRCKCALHTYSSVASTEVAIFYSTPVEASSVYY